MRVVDPATTEDLKNERRVLLKGFVMETPRLPAGPVGAVNRKKRRFPKMDLPCSVSDPRSSIDRPPSRTAGRISDRLQTRLYANYAPVNAGFSRARATVVGSRNLGADEAAYPAYPFDFRRWSAGREDRPTWPLTHI